MSLSYLDHLTGQQKTIRGNADKLVIKRRRPAIQGNRERFVCDGLSRLDKIFVLKQRGQCIK